MNENKIKKNHFRLIFSTIKGHNRLISILLYASVNFVGILYPLFHIFNFNILKFYASPPITDVNIITFTIWFIPISLICLLYLISSLDKKSSWILVIFILCLGIANFVYLLVKPGEIDGINDWEFFKVIFFGRLFGKYFQFLVFYSIFGFIFVIFKSRKKEKVPDGDAS